MSRRRKSTKSGPKRDKIVKGIGGIRPLDPDDPRNPDHACHDGQWDELAIAIGRSIARKQYEREQHERGNPDDEA
jgi:hypothetical protein